MIQGELIELRELKLEDIDILKEGLNTPDIMEQSGRIKVYSKADVEHWIRESWNLINKKSEYVFGILKIKEKKFIGYIKIKILNKQAKRGSISIYIFSDENRYKGFGSQSINVLLEFVFKTLNLHSIQLLVFDTNIKALRCYKKVGFREVGKRRDSDYISGKYITDIVMDLLKKEWEEFNLNKL